jgi:hypothetical protein
MVGGEGDVVRWVIILGGDYYETGLLEKFRGFLDLTDVFRIGFWYRQGTGKGTGEVSLKVNYQSGSSPLTTYFFQLNFPFRVRG